MKSFLPSIHKTKRNFHGPAFTTPLLVWRSTSSSLLLLRYSRYRGQDERQASNLHQWRRLWNVSCSPYWLAICSQYNREALMLGVITSIGGFLFGFDTARLPSVERSIWLTFRLDRDKFPACKSLETLLIALRPIRIHRLVWQPLTKHCWQCWCR